LEMKLKRCFANGTKINVYNRRTALHHRYIFYYFTNFCNGDYGSYYEEIY